MRRYLSASALLLLLLPLAACGDDGDDDAGATDDTTTSSTTAPPAPPASPEAAAADGLVRYERSFGMCLGFCQTVVSFEGALATLVSADRETSEQRTNTGTLTTAGEQAVAAAAASVDPSTLEEVYGCPDCADGGAATVVLGADEVTSTYSASEPPEVFATIDAVGLALTDALSTCVATELVEIDEGCQPLRP